MNYFKDCQNSDDVKRLYRELANKFHPDKGGDASEMAEINKQYHAWKEPAKFSQSYGGYGGYRYNTQSTMWNDYKQQSNDPRLADYERMKAENKRLRQDYLPLQNENDRLWAENAALKKKLDRLKKKVSLSKKKEKNTSKSICL